MSLLARIQAGQQITTVDDLYKRMVLEEPETLATAEAVVAHFDGLESTRTRMLEARQQVRALQPIRTIKTRIDDAAERVRIIDALGRFGDPSSRASLWRAQRRIDLLGAVEDELRERTHATDALVRERQALADAAETERDGLGDVLRAAGGDKLDAAQRELRGLERRRAGMQRDRDRFDAALATLGTEVADAKGFAALTDEARRTLGDTDAKSAVRDAFVAASSRHTALRQQLATLEAEHRRTQTRDDNIPPRLHEAREALAEAAGLTAAELPFVAELVDVRNRIRAVARSVHARTRGLRDDAPRRRRAPGILPAAIDDVRLSERLRFEGVSTGLPERTGLDPATLPGRLDYRPSPFTGWLQDRLEQQFAFVCVDGVSDLSRHRMALTISGQTSQARAARTADRSGRASSGSPAGCGSPNSATRSRASAATSTERRSPSMRRRPRWTRSTIAAAPSRGSPISRGTRWTRHPWIARSNAGPRRSRRSPRETRASPNCRNRSRAPAPARRACAKRSAAPRRNSSVSPPAGQR